jgi:hypothetical protein
MAKRRTDNTMAKREGQTTQWPKEKDRQHNGQKRRTDNTMAKRKRTDNTMAKRKRTKGKAAIYKTSYIK